MRLINSTKSILLFASLVVLSTEIFAQAAVRSYYEAVNRAELHICSTRYGDALAAYDSAFVLKIPWRADLDNAIECAMDAKDTVRFAAYCMQSKGNGLFPDTSWDIYGRMEAFSPIIMGRMSAYLPKGSACRDTAFVREVLSRIDLDQRLDWARIKGLRTKDTLAKIYSDSLETTVRENGLWLKSWIENYGYPSEVCCFNVDSQLNLLPQVETMLRHYFQAKHWDLFDLLKGCVARGELEPTTLADWANNGYVAERFKEYGTVVYYFGGDSLQSRKYKVSMDEIDKNRCSMMMEPYTDYLTKVNYIIDSGNDRYYFRTVPAIFCTVEYDVLMSYLEKRRNGINRK